jgi:hypothetical protein
MKDICVAFKILLDGQSAPIGYQKISCHMIFDIKMEDFRRKARLVAGGHWTQAPATITYASVVSCETVRIALLIAALNDLEVKIGNVLNAYITAPVTKKVWTVLGPEFGSNAGRSAVIAPVLLSACTWPPSCARWVLPLAKPTPTSGTKPRQDLTTTLNTMLIFYATSTISS